MDDDGVERWMAAGLYDPAAPDAAEQLELLRYLDERGISIDEMVARQADCSLTQAAVDAVLRPTRTLSLDDVVARTGLDPDEVGQAWLAFGLPVGPAGSTRYDAADLELLSAVALGQALLGPEAMRQLVRVMGQGLARLAEAAVFGFLVNIEQPMMEHGDTPVERARSSAEALESLLQLPALFAPLFLRHLDSVVERQRASQDRSTFDVFNLAVGFVDLVGYTEWSDTVPLADQRSALADFERVASDAVAARGGRLVKNIGDAVMFVTTEAADACRVALDLCSFVRGQPHLTELRGAVGHGELLGRDGDYFGPTVNLVARAVAQASPGRVVVTAPVEGLSSTPMDPVELRGIEGPTTLYLLDR